jgi:hypothetical protein
MRDKIGLRIARWSCCLAFLLVQSASAEDIATAHAEMTWFRPYLMMQPLRNDATIVLFGKTAAKAIISVDPNLIILVNQTDNAPKAAGAKAVTTTSNAQGYFRLILHVPLGFLELPINVQSGDRLPKTLLITLNIKPESVASSFSTDADTGPVIKWRKSVDNYVAVHIGVGPKIDAILSKGLLWLNLGLSFQNQTEGIGDGKTIKFGQLAYPSAGVKFDYYKPKWMARLQFGRVDGWAGNVAKDTSVENSHYTRQELIFEGGLPYLKKKLNSRSRFDVLFGLEYHSDPFITSPSTSTLTLDTINNVSASLGAQYSLLIKTNQVFQIIMRYEYPFTMTSPGGTSFSFSPGFSFGGALNYIYRLKNPRYFVGASWYGEWLQYHYNFADSNINASYSGLRTLFNSTLDGSVGVTF